MALTNEFRSFRLSTFVPDSKLASENDPSLLVFQSGGGSESGACDTDRVISDISSVSTGTAALVVDARFDPFAFLDGASAFFFGLDESLEVLAFSEALPDFPLSFFELPFDVDSSPAFFEVFFGVVCFLEVSPSFFSLFFLDASLDSGLSAAFFALDSLPFLAAPWSLFLSDDVALPFSGLSFCFFDGFFLSLGDSSSDELLSSELELSESEPSELELLESEPLESELLEPELLEPELLESEL